MFLKLNLFCVLRPLGVLLAMVPSCVDVTVSAAQSPSNSESTSRSRSPAVEQTDSDELSRRTSPQNPTTNPASSKSELDAPFDGEAAYTTLKQICDLGPRPSLSDGMVRQRDLLTTHFEKLDAKVILQPFSARHPNTGNLVTLNNLVVRWHPERKLRLMFCCHYDTRPFPDRDPHNPRGAFIGANDGGSGVAVLCELGKHIANMDGKYGVDFVFFDGEEFVFVADRDPMFLGSTFFANQYATRRFDWKYQFGILLDMVGDANLQIHYEGNSLGFAPRLTRSIWGVADKLGIKEFVPQERHKINDDHLPLNSIARIETCDIIDFDFPTPDSKNAFWHTQQDTVENCSAESLGKVGTVVLAWLREMQTLNSKQKKR